VHRCLTLHRAMHDTFDDTLLHLEVRTRDEVVELFTMVDPNFDNPIFSTGVSSSLGCSAVRNRGPTERADLGRATWR